MAGFEKRLLEAILFLENMPVEAEELAKHIKTNVNECILLLEQLSEEYKAKKSGLDIRNVPGGYQMFPSDDLKDNLVEIFSNRKKSRLSRSVLETLAIIAWQQPVTRPEIESIRGVDCTAPVKMLIEKELVEEKGRKEVIGRPILYGTTNEFLRYFNLKDISQLPQLEEIKNTMFRRIKEDEISDDADIEDSEMDLFRIRDDGINK
jgi:segregation and condensation protein B